MVPPNSQNDQDEIDQLLAIVDRPRREPRYKIHDQQVDRFIKEVGVKAGTTRIPAYIIFYTYFVWKGYNRRTRLSFFRVFGKLFQKTQVFKSVGYLLDPKPFDLTPEGFFKARALLRRERNDSKRKKEKKAAKKLG